MVYLFHPKIGFTEELGPEEVYCDVCGEFIFGKDPMFPKPPKEYTPQRCNSGSRCLSAEKIDGTWLGKQINLGEKVHNMSNCGPHYRFSKRFDRSEGLETLWKIEKLLKLRDENFLQRLWHVLIRKGIVSEIIEELIILDKEIKESKAFWEDSSNKSYPRPDIICEHGFNYSQSQEYCLEYCDICGP